MKNNDENISIEKVGFSGGYERVNIHTHRAKQSVSESFGKTVSSLIHESNRSEVNFIHVS